MEQKNKYTILLAIVFFLFFLLNEKICAQAGEKQAYRFKPGIYFSYTSTCNIAFQVKDSLVSIFLNECCGQPIDSLRLSPSVDNQGPNSFDILDKHGYIHYTIFIHDEAGEQIDMINKGINGPDFIRYDNEAQPIEPENNIITCEHISKSIEFWASPDSIKLNLFKDWLELYIPDHRYVKSLPDENLEPYVKKARYLVFLKRYSEAEVVYKTLIKKSWGIKAYLYKELADCYWEEDKKEEAKNYYIKYLKVQYSIPDSILDRLRELDSLKKD